jgi:hypothetical protein
LIFDLLESTASTVIYAAASSLTALTSNPVAVKAAAQKFIELAIKEADNNVKVGRIGDTILHQLTWPASLLVSSKRFATQQ